MGATGSSVEEGLNDSKPLVYDVSQNEIIDYQKEIVNDFVIPTKNEEEKEKHRGR